VLAQGSRVTRQQRGWAEAKIILQRPTRAAPLSEKRAMDAQY
jgi:hypothetical protein